MKILITAAFIFFVSIVLVFFYSVPWNSQSSSQGVTSSSGEQTWNFQTKTHSETEITKGNVQGNRVLDDQILKAFTKAFIEIQTYLTKAGRKANYNDTKIIVRKHGLNVDSYTMIAAQMNKNPQLYKRIQKFIHEEE